MHTQTRTHNVHKIDRRSHHKDSKPPAEGQKEISTTIISEVKTAPQGPVKTLYTKVEVILQNTKPYVT